MTAMDLMPSYLMEPAMHALRCLYKGSLVVTQKEHNWIMKNRWVAFDEVKGVELFFYLLHIPPNFNLC